MCVYVKVCVYIHIYYIYKTNSIYIICVYTCKHTTHAIIAPQLTGEITLAWRVCIVWLASHSSSVAELGLKPSSLDPEIMPINTALCVPACHRWWTSCEAREAIALILITAPFFFTIYFLFLLVTSHIMLKTSLNFNFWMLITPLKYPPLYIHSLPTIWTFPINF